MTNAIETRLRRVQAQIASEAHIRVLHRQPLPDEFAELERIYAERGYRIRHEEALAEMERIEAEEAAACRARQST